MQESPRTTAITIDSFSEQRSSVISDYEFVGAGSINHPSVDRGSDFSYTSGLYNTCTNDNYATKPGTSRKQSPLTVPRPASHNHCRTQDRAAFESFRSEPIVRGVTAALSAKSVMSTSTSTRSSDVKHTSSWISHDSNNCSSTSGHRPQRRLPLDASSETRRRIERSLSNIRSMSRSTPRSPVLGEKEEEGQYEEELKVDMKIRAIRESFDTRLKTLETCTQELNDRMTVAKRTHPLLTRHVDQGVQTGIAGIHYLAEMEDALPPDVLALQQVMHDLGFKDAHEFKDTVEGWRASIKELESIKDMMRDLGFSDPNEFKEMMESWDENVKQLDAEARRLGTLEDTMAEFGFEDPGDVRNVLINWSENGQRLESKAKEIASVEEYMVEMGCTDLNDLKAEVAKWQDEAKSAGIRARELRVFEELMNDAGHSDVEAFHQAVLDMGKKIKKFETAEKRMVAELGFKGPDEAREVIDDYKSSIKKFESKAQRLTSMEQAIGDLGFTDMKDLKDAVHDLRINNKRLEAKAKKLGSIEEVMGDLGVENVEHLKQMMQNWSENLKVFETKAFQLETLEGTLAELGVNDATDLKYTAETQRNHIKRLEAKLRRMTPLEELMQQLELDDADNFRQMIEDWRTTAKGLETKLESFNAIETMISDIGCEDLNDFQRTVQEWHKNERKLEAKAHRYDSLESMMYDLDYDNVNEFTKKVEDWRNKARFFGQVQGFIDRVDEITWGTPFVSLPNVCGYPRSLTAFFRHSSDNVCESHRAKFERALLESERDKAEAEESTPYSAEHLSATFERLVRWSHTIRYVIA